MQAFLRRVDPVLHQISVVGLAATFAGAAGAQSLVTFTAYPADATSGSVGNNAPLGRNANGGTDEARSQILIPAPFLPPAGGTVIGIEMANLFAANTLNYTSLEIRAANLSNTGPNPVLNPTFATNLGAAPTTVFSVTNTSITWPARTWTRITFQTPFVYLGGDHLVLDFQKAVALGASGGVAHVNDYPARWVNGAYDLPIMMVSYGGVGSNAHLGTVNTSTGARMPPRVRVVFQGAPILCPASLSVPTMSVSDSVVIGGTFAIETQAEVGSVGVQLVELLAPALVSRPSSMILPGVCGEGWVTPGSPTLFTLGLAIFGTTSHSAALTIPASPAFQGMRLGFQSVLLSAPTMVPIWSNATDATVM